MEIGIVILNYLNWTDTVECIESLKSQTNQSFQIVVVDNASTNESFTELENRYESMDTIHLLQTEKNLGFAKGNNVGIVYCQKILNINNVLVINNDVIFTDTSYIDYLINFNIGTDIGVVGTTIIGSDGENQNPLYFNPSIKAVFREFSIPLLRNFHLDGILKIGRAFKQVRNKNESSFSLPSGRAPYILHGSALFLTENYLSKVAGLYPETFLYYEEEILGLVCKKLGLRMLYTDKIEIFHKEDQSSKMSFQNLEQTKFKFARRSVRTGLKVSILSTSKTIYVINSQSYTFIKSKMGQIKKYTFQA